MRATDPFDNLFSM